MEVIEIDGKRAVRQNPIMRLPARSGAYSELETLDDHLLAGSQRALNEKTGELGDYVDKCENHYLLADAYSGLADVVAVAGGKVAPFRYQSVSKRSAGVGKMRGGIAL
jgi:hypothetical protein